MNPEAPALTNVHRTIGDYRPPTMKQWLLWIGGLVLGLAILIGTIVSCAILIQVNARTSQSPAQYAQLHNDLVKLEVLTVDRPGAHATYDQVERQIKDLCGTVPGCNWSNL